jgi:hypothetical protein
MSAGATLRQHGPRLHAGGVFVFDNQGGPTASGGSRIVRIDLATGLPTTVFPRPDMPLPGRFYTHNSGRIDLHPSWNRLLAAVTHEEAIWEIDLATGKVLWEYVESRADPSGRQHPIHSAEYAGQIDFPLNQTAQPRE